MSYAVLFFFFLFWVLFDLLFFSDFRHHQEIYSNLKISSLVIMTCQCQLLSWQSNLVQKMAKGYAIKLTLSTSIFTDNTNRWCGTYMAVSAVVLDYRYVY